MSDRARVGQSVCRLTGPMSWVRLRYGVPAQRGGQITFTGMREGPITGRIISARDGYLWIRRDDNGQRFGPLHPTWEIHYG